MLIQVIVAGVRIHDSGPIDRTCLVTESLNELHGQQVYQGITLLNTGVVMLFSAIADRFDDLAIQFLIAGDKRPEVLTSQL